MPQLSPRRPFDPARWPFFYGWVVLAVGTVGIVASVPGQTTGISVFTDHLLEATGLTRLQLTNAYLFGTLVSGLLLPFGGRWLDAVGARVMGPIAALGMALSLAALSSADRLVAFAGSLTAATVPSAVVGVGVLSVLFGGLRFTGQGLLTLTSRTMIARWFDRYRGLIGATSGAVIGFTFSLAPMVFLGWIERADWQGAWRQMALLLLVFAAVAVVFFRETPEESGLEMDGGTGRDEDGSTGSASRRKEPAWTRSEALATSEFWLITVAVSLQSMLGTGITFHIVDLGREAGIEAARFLRIMVPVSFFSIVTGFLMGYLVDRVRALHIVRVSLLGQLVLYLAAANVSVEWARVAMVAGWGIAAGCYGPLTVAAPARLFGRAHLGSISGVLSMVLVLASAVGPVFLSVLQGVNGLYRTGFFVAALLPLLTFFATWIVPASAQKRAPR